MKQILDLTMRNIFSVFLILISSTSISLIAQSKKIASEDFPADKPINYISGWGDMTVAINSMPAGTDLAPLLEGLKNNSCQVPHWGLIKEGVLKLTYDDGSIQTLKTGDLFYMPPGHVGVVVEDLTIMDFSPSKRWGKLMKHIDDKLAENSQD